MTHHFSVVHPGDGMPIGKGFLVCAVSRGLPGGREPFLAAAVVGVELGCSTLPDETNQCRGRTG